MRERSYLRTGLDSLRKVPIACKSAVITFGIMALLTEGAVQFARRENPSLSTELALALLPYIDARQQRDFLIHFLPNTEECTITNQLGDPAITFYTLNFSHNPFQTQTSTTLLVVVDTNNDASTTIQYGTEKQNSHVIPLDPALTVSEICLGSIEK